MPAHAQRYVIHSGEEFRIVTKSPVSQKAARTIARELRLEGKKARTIRRNSSQHGYVVGVRNDRQRKVRACDV